MNNNIDVFEGQFVAKKASQVGEPKLNNGGRVLLPAMVLQQISSMRMVYPLQFCIQAYRQKPLWAGVLEFSAEMGCIVLPDWMFDQLKLRDNSVVRVQTSNLGSGNLLKLQPHERAFVELQDPRRVLEQHLVNYPVLTNGSTITIFYVQHTFKIDVADILSADGRSLEAVLTARADSQATELKVEFERPLDMPPSPTNGDGSAVALPNVASPTGSNVIGGSAGGGVQFTPFAFKPPTLTGGEGGAGAGAGAPPQAAQPAPVEPAFISFGGAGRKLNGQPAPPPAPAQPPTAQQQQEMREKRLRAFDGKGHSLR